MTAGPHAFRPSRRILGQPPRLRPSRTSPFVALVTLLVLGLAAGCRRQEAPLRQPAQPPNVLLIVIDTMAARSFSPSSDAGSLTPNLARLASRGVTFEHAYSPASWTKPAIASILTGLMPNRHGVVAIPSVLPGGHVTVAETLAAAGYRTAAVVSHTFVSRQYAYDQGFEDFDETPSAGPDPPAIVSSAMVSDSGLRWLRQHKNAPFFLWLHYFDPHFQYVHHPEFDRSSWYRGRIRSDISFDALQDNLARLTRADIRFLHSLHQEEIAFTDYHIGRVLDGLAAMALLHNTLIVLTADHGEEFLEHGALGHTVHLYDEIMHVPLIVSLPGRFAPARRQMPVSLVDILPTVGELCGVARGGQPTDGESLVPYLEGRDLEGSPRPCFAEVDYLPVREAQSDKWTVFRTAMVLGRRKVIHDRRTDAWELYDLASDADERVNLVSQAADARRMQDELRKWERARRRVDLHPPAHMTAEQIERLRSLGYIR